MLVPSSPTRDLRRPPLAAGGLLLAIRLPHPSGGSSAPGSEAPPPDEAERLVYLLQYVAVDYGNAVQDATVVNPVEYEEMQRFTRILVDRFPALQARGAS